MHSSSKDHQPAALGSATPLDERELSLEDEAALEVLRRRWEVKLACLREPGAGERLEAIMSNPPKLNGKVIAGETY